MRTPEVVGTSTYQLETSDQMPADPVPAQVLSAACPKHTHKKSAVAPRNPNSFLILVLPLEHRFYQPPGAPGSPESVCPTREPALRSWAAAPVGRASEERPSPPAASALRPCRGCALRSARPASPSGFPIHSRGT